MLDGLCLPRLLVVLALLAPACEAAPTVGEVPPPSIQAPLDREQAATPLILAHGGQGSPAAASEGPAAAVELGYERLSEGSDAVAAALATIELLEDHPRFNAGTGANLRLDGRTIEADAAIMASDGRFGAVAGLDGVRHPVRAAAAVADTPHLLLAGAGARAFAEALDLERADLYAEPARRRLERGYRGLFAPQLNERRWPDFDWQAHWNFAGTAPTDLDDALARMAAARPDPAPGDASGFGSGSAAGDSEEAEALRDTVGVVVRTADGRYAAALSTGGTTLALRGRVGDVPVLGAGLYAGRHGAVAATGKGEAIIRERVAARVYRGLAAGLEPSDAIRRAMREITPEEGVGVIAVGDSGWAAIATSQMAWALREGEQRERADQFVRRRAR